MNLLLRFIPFIFGGGFAYLIATYVMEFDRSIKFSISSVSMIVMSYLFTWYNIWMMKRTGEISERKVLAPSPLGHVLVIVGSLCLGYGFIENNKILMIVALGVIVLADTLLTKTTSPNVNENSTPKEEMLTQAVNKNKREDPLTGLKVGSDEITQRLLDILKNEKGVHIESLLGIIGSLAGYSCHVACREMFVDTSKALEKDVFTIIRAKDGKNYYFGDLTNQSLVENKLSVWSIVAGITQHLDSDLYDVHTTFANVTGSVGSENFGIPQISERHKPGDIPLNYVRNIWPTLLPLIDKFCAQPIERPVLLGFAAQKAIEMGKDVIPPAEAAKLVMECAVPMSKIGPEWLS